MSYKLKILNGVLKLKTFSDVVLNILGIKDLGTQTGEVTDGYIDWSMQQITKTTAQWNASTYILLKGQVGVEDTGNTSYKIKVGNGVNLWSALSYIGGGAGGSQDLQSVTDLGATTTNAINTAGITSDYFQLDTTATNTNAVAKIVWNDSLGTGEIGLKGGSINAKLTQDLYARVVNKTGANLLYSQSKVVKVQSAQGQRLAVNLAQANNDLNSADTIGLVAENIDNNQEGFVITVGQLAELNTTGSLQGETWTDGDVLYLSPTTAGSITNVKPNGSTGHIVILGYVEYAHAIHGKIYVKIMNGWELDELHNVYINQGTLANNDALIYESSTQLWKNKTIATTLGYSSGTDLKTVIDTKGYVQNFNFNSFSPSDATTYYIGLNVTSPFTTDTSIRLIALKTSTLKKVAITSRQTLGTSENSSFALGVNGTYTTFTSTIKFDGSPNNNALITGLSINVTEGDILTLRWITPTWGTNPTSINCNIALYFE